MEIKRCTKSFRASGRGFSSGDLVPATHALVQAFPGFFEPVEDYVARRFPEHAPKPTSAHTEAPRPVRAKIAAGEQVISGAAVKKAAARKPAARKGA